MRYTSHAAPSDGAGGARRATLYLSGARPGRGRARKPHRYPAPRRAPGTRFRDACRESGRLRIARAIRTLALLLAVTTLAATLATPARADAAGDTPAGEPPVAVASSLRAVWPELERRWRAALPAVGARPTFGASHTLARQIAHGAPFELFLAADERAVASLPPARVLPGSAAIYAHGRLVLVLRGSAAAAADPAAGRASALDRLATLLAADPDARLAIPHPRHAPYGAAAREALAGAGLWPLPPGRLVIGENAAQTLQFLRAGAVEAALLPLSLALEVPGTGFARLPLEATTHAPLVHRMVTIADASPAALALARWLRGAEARAILAAAGFDAPH